MARFIRTAQRTIVSAAFASKTLPNGSQTRIAMAASLLQFKPYATCKTQKSPFKANILRILSNEIEYQRDCVPNFNFLKLFSLLRVSIHLQSKTDRERSG